MSANPAGPDPASETNRVRCAYCGANNFPASAACWQCGRPLQPLRAGAASTSLPTAGPTSNRPPAGPPAWPAAPAAGYGLTGGVNPSLAPKAAAALGLLFPWAGLPLGLAFLMLDDPRKAQLGWIAIGWSVAGTVLNLLLVIMPLAGLWPVLKSVISHPPGGGVPSLPPLGGGEGILFVQSCFHPPQ